MPKQDRSARKILPVNPAKRGHGHPRKWKCHQAAAELGQGWKVNPFIVIEPGQTFTMAEISGSGSIQHIWMTPTGNWRYSILRFYWDDERRLPWNLRSVIFLEWVGGNMPRLVLLLLPLIQGSAFNCYWPMPFRKKCRITMENINTQRMVLYYQVDYTLTRSPG